MVLARRKRTARGVANAALTLCLHARPHETSSELHLGLLHGKQVEALLADKPLLGELVVR